MKKMLREKENATCKISSSFFVDMNGYVLIQVLQWGHQLKNIALTVNGYYTVTNYSAINNQFMTEKNLDHIFLEQMPEIKSIQMQIILTTPTQLRNQRHKINASHKLHICGIIIANRLRWWIYFMTVSSSATAGSNHV